MTLTLTFMVKCKYTHQKPICDFLCIDNINSYSICHYLRDIHSQNLQHDLEIRPLERAKVKCKYTIRKPISDFLCWQQWYLLYLSQIARYPRLIYRNGIDSNLWPSKNRSRSRATTSENTPLEGFCSLQVGEKKWQIYLKPFSIGPPSWQHTWTDKTTIGKGEENAMHCISHTKMR